MAAAQMTRRLQDLADRGVIVVDPRQTWVADDVELERICAGAILHPGTRLAGARTLVGPQAQVGVEGPATLIDAVLGPGARVDGGYVNGAVLLDRARAGFGAHFRPGTLLEEEASTAHCVGLKHTILLAFVTIGSLVNFCDVLMAGGTSRQDHSEVGSGFIHFNYTPWGRHGDKATASLVGDVTRGALLRSERIFLGGAGGLVGPTSIGYGAVTGAGQVVRRDIPARRLVVDRPVAVDVELEPGRLGSAGARGDKNAAYIAQLVALRAWYREVRARRVPESAHVGDSAWVRRAVVAAAIETLDLCIDERIARLDAFLRERGETLPQHLARLKSSRGNEPACPFTFGPSDDGDHVTWVRRLADGDVERLQTWLEAVAQSVTG